MLRRDFLRRLSLTAAGLLVADDALELLTQRKVWAGHDFGPYGLLGIVDAGPSYLGLGATLHPYLWSARRNRMGELTGIA